MKNQQEEIEFLLGSKTREELLERKRQVSPETRALAEGEGISVKLFGVDTHEDRKVYTSLRKEQSEDFDLS